jgi:PAS domain-containing protein
MLHRHTPLLNPDRLREQAVRRLQDNPDQSVPINDRDATLYRLELEIQNEHLRQALLDAEAARERYAELFDYAPIAFLAMDIAGNIDEANLTARLMLDPDDALPPSPGSIFRYLPGDGTDRLNACLQHIRAGRLRSQCQITLVTGDGTPRAVTAYITVVPEPSAARLRVALVDLLPPAV